MPESLIIDAEAVQAVANALKALEMHVKNDLEQLAGLVNQLEWALPDADVGAAAHLRQAMTQGMGVTELLQTTQARLLEVVQDTVQVEQALASKVSFAFDWKRPLGEILIGVTGLGIGIGIIHPQPPQIPPGAGPPVETPVPPAEPVDQPHGPHGPGEPDPNPPGGNDPIPGAGSPPPGGAGGGGAGAPGGSGGSGGGGLPPTDPPPYGGQGQGPRGQGGPGTPFPGGNDRPPGAAGGAGGGGKQHFSIDLPGLPPFVVPILFPPDWPVTTTPIWKGLGTDVAKPRIGWPWH